MGVIKPPIFMKTYTPQAPIPAAAITLATTATQEQPILFTTQHGIKDAEEGRQLRWVIRQLKVTLARDWSTSQAVITLTANVEDPRGRLPSLPCVSKWRGGLLEQLTVEDEIRIYAGYIGSREVPIQASLLDETPIDLCPFDLYEGGPGRCDIGQPPFQEDCTKPLAPIFWGFIDSINFTGSSSSGEQITISCRDRMRVLSDTKIISIPHLEGSKKGLAANGDRAEIIHDVIKAATGYTLGNNGERTNCWKDTYKGLVFKAFDLEGVDKCTSPLEDPPLWNRVASTSPMRTDASPRIHMWVQRPPLLKDHNAAVFQVLDKQPLQIIQYLADTEERVTDFYASHVNGDYVFAPRVLDTSGFYDPKRMYRTYFYKTWPDAQPYTNQMIKSIRSISSTLGTFNQFVVAESQNGSQGTFMEGIQVMMNTQLPIMEGRSIMPPCRMQIIYDDSLSTYSNPSGGALLAAINQARVWSRDIGGVEITVLGDPTLYPSEAIRVYNSVLHDKGMLIDPGTQLSELKREEVRLRQTKLGSSETKITKTAIDPTVQRESRSIVECLVPTSPGEVLPVYKIRNIQHNLTTIGKDAGFTSKIRAVADYS